MSTERSARPYRSELRRERAAATRQRIIEVAAEQFGRQGYRSTTLAQIAVRAGVALETVQKQGSKAALLRAAVEFASFGVEGEASFFATPAGEAMQSIGEPAALAQFAGDAMLAINEPTAGLWMAVTAAAPHEPEVRLLRERLLASIRGQVEQILGWVKDRGWLRGDLPFEELVESFCVITSVESYIRFVLLDSKTREDYRAFVARMVKETILVRTDE